MNEWTPSDKELVETLCRVRETDWKWADYRANNALAEMIDGTVKYEVDAPSDEYGEFLWKKKSYPVIPPEMMQSPQAWRNMALSEVLHNIFCQKGAEADTHRQSLLLAIDDYRLAAKAKLIDTLQSVKKSNQCFFWESECQDCREDGLLVYKDINRRIQAIRDAKELSIEHIPSKPITGRFIEFLGNEKRDEWDVTTDEHLIKKIIICQRLKVLISKRTESSLQENPPEPKSSIHRKPEIFVLFDDIWREADELSKAEMTRFMPGNCKRGNKKKGVKTKRQFLKELENQCEENGKKVETGDTFRTNYDKWAKDRHPNLIQSNSDK